ncbi:hypothetical protein ACFVVU_23775 [Kitasatospora sp. NPDC057965]|uniref:hypothetical protein n=1 Tax=Kitasatospora sp. NPDC057965 TaxID=3346291 RepID=UPI0036DC4C57
MSDRIPPDRQGRWRDQRGSSRGPGRTGRTTLMPPGVIPADLSEALDTPGFEDEEDEKMAQRKPGSPNPAGDPKAPPAGPQTPPPPPPPPSE